MRDLDPEPALIRQGLDVPFFAVDTDRSAS